MPPQTPEPDRRESWKQIGAYLDKSERTVRRWNELEGLPVHKHPHQQKGTVWAYRSEIDGGKPMGMDDARQKRGGVPGLGAGHGEAGVAAQAFAQNWVLQYSEAFSNARRGAMSRSRRACSSAPAWSAMTGAGGRRGIPLPLCDSLSFVVLNRKILEKFYVLPGKKFRLKDIDPGWRGDGETKELTDAELKVSA